MFDRLKALIATGDLQPGDAMPSERELMERFGVASTTRASFGLYNTRADVDVLIAGLHKAREILG